MNMSNRFHLYKQPFMLIYIFKIKVGFYFILCYTIILHNKLLGLYKSCNSIIDFLKLTYKWVTGKENILPFLIVLLQL